MTITTKVKGALLVDGAVKLFEIKVETFRGTVRLSWFVDSSDQRSAAERTSALDDEPPVTAG
jgi:osmotically-inducible protein OsmY